MTDERTEVAGTVKESPQLSEAPKEAKAETSPEDQAKALLGELQRIGVKKPEDILNMAQASSQVGRTQNLLGEANRKIAELNAQVQALTMASLGSKSRHQNVDDSEGQTIDLATLIEQKSYTASKKAVQEVVEQMTAVQRKQASEFAAVRKDRFFPQLEKPWNEYLGTPEAQEQLMSGVSPKELYGDVRTAYLERLVERSATTIEGLVGLSPEKAKPLHVESSQTRVPSLPQEEDDKKTELRKIDDLRRSGRMSSDQALQAIFDRVSPKDDPIWSVSTAPTKKR